MLQNKCHGMCTLLLIAVAVATTAVAESDLLNVQCSLNETALKQFIDNQIEANLADEPGNDIRLGYSGLGATISLANPSLAATSTNNLLAYRPRFADHHGSRLAGIFINLEQLFQCSSRRPTCFTATAEEDGFNNGRVVLDASDGGNNFRVFSRSEDIHTYGIAIQDCPEITTGCFPRYYAMTVICLLPRGLCG